MNQQLHQLTTLIQQQNSQLLAKQTSTATYSNAIDATIADTPFDNHWAQGVKKATHSVVSIYAEASKVSGSGIILDNEGLIASNAHVVETALSNNENFQVMLSDGRQYAANVIAISKQLDVALLLIDAPSLQAIHLAETKPLLGQPVFSIGNPLSIGQTASMGIVSGFKQFSYFGQDSTEYIQTDALIHPGSSGGALVNQTGEMLGMNALFLSSKQMTEQHLGINFVIPIKSVFNEIQRLLNQTDLTDSHYLGLSVMRVMNHEMFNQRFIVSHVTQGSPADKLGLKMGDIFDQSFNTEIALRKALKAGKVDNIIRNEQTMDM
jgi:S1-C subfamily serine protease